MSAEDTQSQSVMEEGSGGPGAPTGLAALEVGSVVQPINTILNLYLGYKWYH